MAKPQINKIEPFDANFDKEISFSWKGFQSYSNRIIIYNNETLAVIFDETIKTMTYTHTIPRNTLENGKTYIIQCQILDSYGNESELSNKYYFKTYTTPQFSFDNIIDGETIATSSCSTTVFYFQLESEPLSHFQFLLYDSSKNLISQTNENYETDNISNIYKGLTTETIYYIRCIGLTKNGISVDTGFLKIYVNYGIKHNYARIYVENDSRTGGITYRTNINSIEPNGDEEYEYIDGKINVTDKTLVYKEGFKINGDFTLKISGSHLYRNGEILVLKNEESKIIVSSYVYDDCGVRYKITISNGISNYIIYSEPLYIDNNTLITIVIRRLNGLYGIKVYEN